VAVLALSATAAPATTVAAANLPSGHFTWTGNAAASFVVPGDMRKVASRHDSKFNLDYVSYQQYVGPIGTLVDGGQLTVVSRGGKQLIVGGASNKQVASALDISERTVKGHLSNVFQKLGVSDRLKLVLYVTDGKPATAAMVRK